MKIQFWGTRGSLATPGPETTVFGGNTSCVQVTGKAGGILVLDAGTGLMRLGASLPKGLKRIDVLLTHLHMDHIQGLGFFAALYNPNLEVHLWGPASTTLGLRARLARYLSPPLFPVQLRDLPCKLEIHHVPRKEHDIGEFRVRSWLICHPGPTVGYRISADGATIAYMPDHEPLLGLDSWPKSDDWISGYSCAKDCDILIHDAQYTKAQYEQRVGWGHSQFQHALSFAERTGVKHLWTFHHDPSHSDVVLNKITQEAVMQSAVKFPVSIAAEGKEIEL